MKFEISKEWSMKMAELEGNCDITAGYAPPTGEPGTMNDQGCYYLKVGDIPQPGDYRRLSSPSPSKETWYPITSYHPITKIEEQCYLHVRPNPKWRHTDEFEPITPDWLKQS